MNEIGLSWPKESVSLDPDRMCEIYTHLGEKSAEAVICDAVEELAVALASSERAFLGGDWGKLYEKALMLQQKAQWLGLCKLARIAGDTAHLVENGDRVALAAVLGRLLRVGERSVMTIWEAQDLHG